MPEPVEGRGSGVPFAVPIGAVVLAVATTVAAIVLDSNPGIVPESRLLVGGGLAVLALAVIGLIRQQSNGELVGYGVLALYGLGLLAFGSLGCWVLSQTGGSCF